MKLAHEDLQRGRELFGYLATVNTGLGRAVMRMLTHEDNTGELPVGELRELATLLREVADKVDAYVDSCHPIVDSP